MLHHIKMAAARQLLRKGIGLVAEALTVNEVIDSMINGAATLLKDWCSCGTIDKNALLCYCLPTNRFGSKQDCSF